MIASKPVVGKYFNFKGEILECLYDQFPERRQRIQWVEHCILVRKEPYSLELAGPAGTLLSGVANPSEGKGAIGTVEMSCHSKTGFLSVERRYMLPNTWSAKADRTSGLAATGMRLPRLVAALLRLIHRLIFLCV
jgi:hypothetical protein